MTLTPQGPEAGPASTLDPDALEQLARALLDAARRPQTPRCVDALVAELGRHPHAARLASARLRFVELSAAGERRDGPGLDAMLGQAQREYHEARAAFVAAGLPELAREEG